MSNQGSMAGYARPSTLLEAFARPLPQLSRPSSSQYAAVRASGGTTENAIPPLVLLCNGVETFLDRANEVLNRPDIKNQARLKGPPPDLESAHDTTSESDVVTASGVFILTDICEILNIRYPGKWKYRTEASKSSLIKAAGSGKGSGSSESVRYDLIFYTVDSNGKLGKPIAILEYKKRDMIRYQDFDKGLIANYPKTASTSDIDQAKYDARQNGNRLILNADTYLKQISVYAMSMNCPHVALFNWDHFMMFTFDTGSTIKPFTAGDHAHLTWVCEKAMGRSLMIQCPIRKAMLGWLLSAFSERFD